jgi:hypothetical protein
VDARFGGSGVVANAVGATGSELGTFGNANPYVGPSFETLERCRLPFTWSAYMLGPFSAILQTSQYHVPGFSGCFAYDD